MLLVAHRGSRTRAPENTILAFDLALEEGADGLEFDVLVTSDGVPVVSHDDRVLRMCGIDARISTSTALQVATWDAGAGGRTEARIPTLEEMLVRYAGKTDLYLELKAVLGGPTGFISSSVASNASLPLLVGIDRLVVSSFDPAGPAIARAAGHRVAHGVVKGAACTPFMTTAAAAGCEQIHPEADMVDDTLIATAHEAGLVVIAWTVNDPVRAVALSAGGIDGVFTDDVVAIRAAL